MPKPFYPEPALEAHGIPPDAFHDPGCYALALDVPTTPAAWHAHYDVDPPAPLVSAVEEGRDIVYVGATKSLCDRLHDHVAADVRRAGLLVVCPPVDVAAVWLDSEPFVAETRYAYHYARENPGVAVACNGGWF